MNAIPHTKLDAIIGCLLGTAVGDSMGLPSEGLSRKRQRRLIPNLEKQHLLFGIGMTSDDTEHTCFVAQSLIESGGQVDGFTRALARRLRYWLLGLPGGVGFATLRAVLKLWLGFPPHRSGVFSAGNGPAMRSAILGVCFGDDADKLREFVRAATRITHTDPKAEYGAFAVALAAHLAATNATIAPQTFQAQLESLLGEEAREFLQLTRRATESVVRQESTETFADTLKLTKGITGYVYHTVPTALHVWLRNQRDYRAAVTEIIRCGGDTDTTAAIVGGIVGAATGKAGIPSVWLDGLHDWPRTTTWIEALGKQLNQMISTGTHVRPIGLLVVGLLLRNILFFGVVIAHILRRLLPPY